MLFRLVAADLRTVLKKNIITFIAIAAVTVANLVYAYGFVFCVWGQDGCLGVCGQSCARVCRICSV